MKYAELKRSLAGGAAPIYNITGSDDFLRSHAVGLIKNSCISFPEMNFISIEGKALSEDYSNDIVAKLTSFPFLSDKRVVELVEYYPSADELRRTGLADYLNEPLNSTVLIINNKKEWRGFDKFTAVKVDCTSEPSLCIGWIINEAGKASVKIAPSVAERIARYCLYDFSKINVEISKLKEYCASAGVVEDEDVETIVTKDNDYKIYELAEKIAANDAESALAIYEDLLSNNENAQKIFISVYSFFRRLMVVSASEDSDEELADTLDMKEFAVRSLRQQVRQVSFKRVRYICDIFAEYDRKFKSGDMSQDNALAVGILRSLFEEIKQKVEI